MILQRVALYPQMRLDVPDARAIEAFGQNDWKYFLSGIISAKSLVISGFEITNYPNIFTVPGVKLQLNNVSLIHPEAATQAAGFYVSSGSEPDANLILNPSTTNFVELDLKNTPGTRDVRAFWDPGANGGEGGEFTDTVDTVINLDLEVLVNVSGFTSGRIALYKIVTNASGVVTEITDCRPLFFRLGSGGTSPDPDHEATFPNLPDLAHAQFETPVKATQATTSNAPFQGGDKNLRSLKQWMDVVMTLLKTSNGVPYWYMKPQASLAGVYQNAASCILSGGTWEHLGKSAKVTATTTNSVTVQTGTLFNAGPSTFKVGTSVYNYTSYNSATGVFSGVTPNPSAVPIGDYVQQGAIGHLKLHDGSVLVRFGQANSTLTSFSDVDLTTYRTLFTILSSSGSAFGYTMGEDGLTPIIPKTLTSISNGSLTAATGGNYRATAGKVMVRGQEFSYTSYNTATGLFLGVSPDPTGLLKVGDFVYQAASGLTAYYHVSDSADVPGVVDGVSEGAERVFWIAYFDGNNTIFIRDSELLPGESAAVGSPDPNQIYAFVGSSGPNDAFPVYNVNSIANGTALVDAIGAAFTVIETPIYDEIIPAPLGYPVDAIINLPINSKTSTPGAYSIGTDELEIYRDGILLRKGYDYSELTSTQIQVLREIYADSYIRFRIASIGGAGAASGGGPPGTSLQDGYNNGATIVTVPGTPVVIDGASGNKLLHIKGDMLVDGVIDPTGLEFDEVNTSPLAVGKSGFYVHPTDGLIFMKKNGPTAAVQVKISEVVANLSGDSGSLKRSMQNASGATIPAGTPVYISGIRQIALADADNEAAARFFGITAQTIASGAFGDVIYQGVVPGILSGTGIPAGEYLWLQTTPGSMDTMPPDTSGSFLIIIGISDGDDLILQQQTNGRLE